MDNATNKLQTRPPIVVVLGHVDHGKSTLLDSIRKANTVDKEAGGITQHIAAYEVEHEYEGKRRRITFIDTPGHAAFQAIRSRGASVADIAILVVAADDGVKAQTLEALGAIRSSNVPFVVAINKIDKPNADIARTQSSLLEAGVYLEQLGGDVSWVAVSAKQGTGVSDLLDLILLAADLKEINAQYDAPATGYVIEAHLDQKRGIAATLIIRDGTLSNGETVVAGTAISPVRILENSIGKTIKKATPSMPVLLAPFDALPEAGAAFLTFGSKRDAEQERSRRQSVVKTPSHASAATAEGKYLMPVVIRADALGSMEAIVHESKNVGDETRGIEIIQSGIGDISEGDVKAAIAARSPVLIGFNVTLDRLAEALARQHGIPFESFAIIYKLTERLGEILKEHGPMRTRETEIGRAKILKVFSSRKDEYLIGARVESGMIDIEKDIRLLRRKEEVGKGEIASMQSARKEVRSAGEGGEFGAQVTLSVTPTEGDVIQCYEVEEF